MFCPMCGNQIIAEGMRFCIYCGTDIQARTIAAAPASSPVPPAPSAPQVASSPATGNVDVWLNSFGDTKIAVIKVIRALTGWGLREAKDLVDSAPVVMRSNISPNEARFIKAELEGAGATVTLEPTGSPASGSSPSTVSSQATGAFADVELTSYGESKIATIKEIRSLTGLGLVGAKELVESAPVIIMSNVPQAEARIIERRLTEAGAIVTLHWR